VDYSGGYVIHLSAGVAAFVGAAIIGPRRWQDRENAFPSNLMMVAVGCGHTLARLERIQRRDPSTAGIDAASAVLNTNVATAMGVITWLVLDMSSPSRRSDIPGRDKRMLCGLVAITPSAGWVNGTGALLVGLTSATIVWFAWNYLSRCRPFSKVDDAMGVVYTHGIADWSGDCWSGSSPTRG